MAEKEGVYIDNNDIKNVAEDVEDILGHAADLMNPKYPFMKQAIKQDAELRFSAPVQKLVKMVLSDFGITNKQTFRKAVRAIQKAAEDIEVMNPIFERAEKAADRLIRFYCNALEIGDLPTGPRKRWVNKLAAKLHKIMKSGRPIRELERFIETYGSKFLHVASRWMRQVEREEQKYNKNKGI